MTIMLHHLEPQSDIQQVHLPASATAPLVLAHTCLSSQAPMSLGRHMGPYTLNMSATAARLMSASSSATASTAASHTAWLLANWRTTPYIQLHTAFEGSSL